MIDKPTLPIRTADELDKPTLPIFQLNFNFRECSKRTGALRQ